MIGVGIDLVLISRMANRDDLAKHLLSPEEWELYERRTDKAQFLAGRFAVREAFVKAMKGQVGPRDYPQICVLYDELGAPYLLFKERKYTVSIAHDGDYAIAMVVVE